MSGPWIDNDVVGIPFVEAELQVKHLKHGLSGVYAIRHLNDDVRYVGQAACLRKRFENHESGFDCAYFEILETKDCDTLFDRLDLETRHITRLILDGHPLKNNCHTAKAARKRLGHD